MSLHYRGKIEYKRIHIMKNVDVTLSNPHPKFNL